MKKVAAAVLVFAALLGVQSCDESLPDGARVEGIVVEVDGNLEAVQSFTVVDGEGVRWVFVPEEGLTFHGSPLSHLSSHVTSGDPVVVVYEERGGANTAIGVEDA